MAKEVACEENQWKTCPLFTSNENFQDATLQYENEGKMGGDDKSIDPNTCNENQMKQHEADVDLKRKGKEIDVENEGGEHKRKKNRQPYSSETRVSVERNRRSTETKLYADLRALLPSFSTKGYRSKILEEAINTIKSLEETLHGLEKQKQERLYGASQSHNNNTEAPDLSMNKGGPVDTISDQSSNWFKTWASSNVVLTVCGADALISICSEKIPELFSTICFVLENHNMDVLFAEINSDRAKTMYMIRVHHDVPPELAKGFPYEEMYEEAVEQIAQLVTFQN